MCEVEAADDRTLKGVEETESNGVEEGEDGMSVAGGDSEEELAA